MTNYFFNQNSEFERRALYEALLESMEPASPRDKVRINMIRQA
ncbi:MAG: hypothetical protein AABX11_07845 [Nanoarchaeota archaeon]|mgnify:CR=1